MEANTYQAAVVRFVRHASGHGVVEATAGSGKTTTLVMVARTLVGELGVPPSQVAFLAFNRSAAAELRRRLPAGVEALTLHALGRDVLLRSGVDVRLHEDKYERLATALPGAAPEARHALAALARFARLELLDPTDEQAMASLPARYGVELPGPAAAVRDAIARLLDAGAAATEQDYTDLLYLPVRLGLPPPRYAFVCVDEAQDMSRVSLAFVERLIGAGARALFVGDPYQAIYAFAGADRRSLSRVVERTGATQLPLSVSFRCPSRHVALARRFSPAMLPDAAARPGEVKLTDLARLPVEARPGDLVLSRTNGPLLDLALALASRGLTVAVLGDDLLPGSAALAAALAAAGQLTKAGVAASLDGERRRLETEHLLSLTLPRLLEASRLRHAAVATALEAAGSGDPVAVGATLGRLFPVGEPEDGRHVLLSTVHKAKGREAERVFLLAPEELGLGVDLRPRSAAGADDPSSTAADPAADEDAAEANVLFVALTRAKRELVLVERSRGAVAERLARHAREGAPGWLAARWDDVLRLALLMRQAPRAPGISSRHGEARRVQDAGGQAGGDRRGRRGRPHRVGRGLGGLLP